jgi:hypothetical protein
LETPKLSVPDFGAAAIRLPITHYREFLRLSCVPIALALPFQLLSVYTLQHWPKHHLVVGIVTLPPIVINPSRLHGSGYP